jgi:hypothetical protein
MKNIAFTLALMLMASLSFTQDFSGLEIMQKVYDRPAGEDQTASLTMTLINSRGDERVREIRQFQKKSTDIEKKIMFFTAPADVYNTSFMSWSYLQEDKYDDQWIYLPALKRIKRISSDSKGDYFMGSDFTYDDLGDRSPEKDDHTALGEEVFEGYMCYLVKSTPKEDDYMYSSTISWVIKDKWITKKKEFYDEDGELLKILTVKNIDNIEELDIITHSEMLNIQSDHKTVMQLKNVELNSGVQDTYFSERYMKRGL